MNLKLHTLAVLFAFVLSGCDNASDKPTASGALQASAVGAKPERPTPNQGVEISLQFKGDLYSAPESRTACTAEVKTGTLTVTCPVLADYHILSEPMELVAGQTYKISGQVKGDGLASNKEPNAAGVALLGEKMLVEIPSGTYDWRAVEASFTVPSTGSRKFAVGVGGWKQGKGKLEVKELKLYK